MNLKQSIFGLTLGLALLAGSQSAQAARYTRTVPATFRHTWYCYDSKTQYKKAQITKHGIKETIYRAHQRPQIGANLHGKRFMVIIHSSKKVSFYGTQYGILKPASDSMVLTKQTKHSRSSLKISTAGYPSTYYRSKSAAYQYH